MPQNTNKFRFTSFDNLSCMYYSFSRLFKIEKNLISLFFVVGILVYIFLFLFGTCFLRNPTFLIIIFSKLFLISFSFPGCQVFDSATVAEAWLRCVLNCPLMHVSLFTQLSYACLFLLLTYIVLFVLHLATIFNIFFLIFHLYSADSLP